MPCNSPLEGWKSRLNGGLTFDPKQGDGFLTVPCGRCMGCRIDKARHWTVRVAHETQLHDESVFVTLTYSDQNLPDPPSVSRRDCQLWIKRLRKELGSNLIRYFGCGEYGGRQGRPHYHFIIFGHSFREDRYPWATSKSGLIEYRSPLLEKTWGHGHCTLSDITPSSGGYVARYTTKKTATNRDRINAQTGELYTVDPEFLLMSRRPGIGAGWFDRHSPDLFPNNFAVINGTKFPVPPYYWDKLQKIAEETGDYELVDLVKTRRQEALQLLTEKGELTPNRLMTKQTSAELRAAASSRDLNE